MPPDILDLENRLTTAERTGDAHALSLLLSDSFTGINMHGAGINKDQFIVAFSRATICFESLEIEDVNVRRIDSTAVVLGRAVFKCRAGGRSLAGSTRFLNCWASSNNTWHLVASSVVREPEKAT